MKLTILTENSAGSGFLAEHGLSYLVESGEHTLLFDTGSTDVFIRNAEKLGRNLQKEVDLIVLSHGHWDHGNGLKYIDDKPLYLHPGSMIKRYRKNDRSFVGLACSEDFLRNRFSLNYVKEAQTFSESLLFLGEIPRVTGFESVSTSFIDEHGEPDFLPDDSALVCVEDDALIVISGCAHSGIGNIILHAIRTTGIQRIKSVIGGFHLKYNNLQTKETIKLLKNLGVKTLFPSHCTAFPALMAFAGEWQIDQLKTGMVLEL